MARRGCDEVNPRKGRTPAGPDEPLHVSQNSAQIRPTAGGYREDAGCETKLGAKVSRCQRAQEDPPHSCRNPVSKRPGTSGPRAPSVADPEGVEDALTCGKGAQPGRRLATRDRCMAPAQKFFQKKSREPRTGIWIGRKKITHLPATSK